MEWCCRYGVIISCCTCREKEEEWRKRTHKGKRRMDALRVEWIEACFILGEEKKFSRELTEVPEPALIQAANTHTDSHTNTETYTLTDTHAYTPDMHYSMKF